MNLILFEPKELESPLSMSDPRASHITSVLRRNVGDTLDIGVIDGALGKATVTRVTNAELTLDFEWTALPPPQAPISLIVGMPRPQTARRILREVTAVGVTRIEFVNTERTDPSYAKSRLWKSDEWRRHLIVGAQQAFCTRLPTVMIGRELEDAARDSCKLTTRLALDNYESDERLIRAPIQAPTIVAVGPERGWSAEDRVTLREARFSFVDLGSRVLRVETASMIGTAIVRQLLER